MNYYIEVLKKYAVFEGRARRAEYWMFVLVNFIIYMALEVLVAVTKNSAVGTIFALLSVFYTFGVIIPNIAVTARRLHDTDRSGWWMLIGLIPFVGGIILLVFLATDGTAGTNRFGANPKGVVTAATASTM